MFRFKVEELQEISEFKSGEEKVVKMQAEQLAIFKYDESEVMAINSRAESEGIMTIVLK